MSMLWTWLSSGEFISDGLRLHVSSSDRGTFHENEFLDTWGCKGTQCLEVSAH